MAGLGRKLRRSAAAVSTDIAMALIRDLGAALRHPGLDLADGHRVTSASR